MKWAGIILTDNVHLGEAMKAELGLTSWLVTSAKRILDGGCRGVTAAPRLFILGGEPYAVRDQLLAVFNGHDPALYWLTGGAL